MLKIKKISNFKLKSKKILIRVDLNVPIKNGIITDDTRIKNIIPSLKKIINNGGLPIMISHLGRPKNKNNKYSLKKIVKPLSKILGKKVSKSEEILSFKKSKLSVAICSNTNALNPPPNEGFNGLSP